MKSFKEKSHYNTSRILVLVLSGVASLVRKVPLTHCVNLKKSHPLFLLAQHISFLRQNPDFPRVLLSPTHWPVRISILPLISIPPTTTVIGEDPRVRSDS